MIKKRYILFILLIFFAFGENIYAGEGGYGDNGGGNNTGDGGTVVTKSYPDNIVCTYKYSINVDNTFTINTYDLTDSWTNPNTIKPTKDTAAGTYVGMEVKEKKTVSYSAKIISIEQTKYDCSCWRPAPCPPKDSDSSKTTPNGNNGRSGIRNRNLIASTKNFAFFGCRESYTLSNVLSCPSGCSVSNTHVTHPGDIVGCENDALADAKRRAAGVNTGASYYLKLQDPNDIKGTKTVRVDAKSSCGSNGQTRSCEHTYSINKACMNVKTAAVRYIVGNGNCDSSEEITIEKKHWPYFVPLNTKSTDIYALYALPLSSSLTSGTLCQDIISRYHNPTGLYYKEIILTSKLTPFNGKTWQNDHTTAAQGCYLSSTVVIPTEQKFYNEENKGTELRGYAFYYRPIDISNPFPNGISSDSYWYNWSKTGKSDPNLNDSFSTTTYSTGIINASAVRDYNKRYKYTSWADMKVSGISSEFIGNLGNTKGFVQRQSGFDANKIYKLGCGPMNKDWSECK